MRSFLAGRTIAEYLYIRMRECVCVCVLYTLVYGYNWINRHSILDASVEKSALGLAPKQTRLIIVCMTH